VRINFILQLVIISLLMYVAYCLKGVNDNIRLTNYKLKQSFLVIEEKMLSNKIDVSVDLSGIEKKVDKTLNNLKSDVWDILDEINKLQQKSNNQRIIPPRWHKIKL